MYPILTYVHSIERMCHVSCFFFFLMTCQGKIGPSCSESYQVTKLGPQSQAT